MAPRPLRGLVFHAPEVYQDRNQHDLMADFRDELPGYVHNAKIGFCLESLSLESDPAAIAENMYRCYEMLVAQDILPPAELPMVRAWMEDLSAMAAR